MIIVLFHAYFEVLSSVFIVMMAAIREKTTYSQIPAALKGPGIAFIITGLMGIAFMIFSGIQF